MKRGSSLSQLGSFWKKKSNSLRHKRRYFVCGPKLSLQMAENGWKSYVELFFSIEVLIILKLPLQKGLILSHDIHD